MARSCKLWSDLEDRRDVGGEHETAVITLVRPIEGLLAERIGCEHERALLLVPDSEREHAVHAVESALAPLVPCMQQNLGVTFGRERVTATAQLVAKLHVVVDLAVHDEAPGAERERLVRALVKVDDGESPEGETCAGPDVEAFPVGASMCHGGGHPLEKLAGRVLASYDAADPAHSVQRNEVAECSPARGRGE